MAPLPKAQSEIPRYNGIGGNQPAIYNYIKTLAIFVRDRE